VIIIEKQQYQAQQADTQKNISKILDKNARERLSMLRVVRPELASQLENYLAQLFESGQIRGTINEEKFIMILRKISEKREITISRK